MILTNGKALCGAFFASHGELLGEGIKWQESEMQAFYNICNIDVPEWF